MFALLDTNVWLSFLLHRRGVCRRVIEAADEQCEYVTSSYLRDEVWRKLTTKFDRDEQTANELIDELVSQSVLFEGSTPLDVSLTDADDLPILATAVAFGCQFLVTGDKELLEL